jgi:transposase
MNSNATERETNLEMITNYEAGTIISDGRTETPQRARRQRISQDLRDRFVRFVQSTPATSISAAANAFGLPKSTAHSIIRRNEKMETVADSNRGRQNPSKITSHACSALADWVNERPDATLECLKNKLMAEHGISVCKATLSKALTKIGFTVKLIRPMPLSRNSRDTVLSRKNYAEKFLDEAPLDRREIIWVDECGFNLHLRRKFGRARRGHHASLTVPNGRGQNISVCAAMSEEGLLHEYLRPGAFNGEHFCSFLTGLFELLRTMGRNNCWIIMDNVRFHHSASVRTCAESFGHQLVFLPPYSPMLNPIESVFGKWKTLIRTDGVSMNRDELLERMSSARYEISIRDCLGWIRDTGRNIGLSLQDHIFD